MKRYNLSPTKEFKKSLDKLITGNLQLIKRVEKTLILLSKDPFIRGLRTHKVPTRIYGIRYSSRVTGNIRIIWDFEEEKKSLIILITIGGHAGKHRVYK